MRVQTLSSLGVNFAKHPLERPAPIEPTLRAVTAQDNL